MKTLLRIDCSSRITGSHSRALTDYFEEHWITINPKCEIIYRDLTKQQIPHIQNNTIEGFYTPDAHMTPETKAATALSDELITELKQADVILISSPLYNLNVPSNLKAYFDQITRIGHTFTMTDGNFKGLLTNKKAYLITAKGGIYKNSPMEAYDFQEPYLKTMLGYIGIQDIEIFSLEGTTGDSETLSVNTSKLQHTISEHLNH